MRKFDFKAQNPVGATTTGRADVALDVEELPPAW